MPKFIYSLGILKLLTLTGIIYLITNKEPSEPYSTQIFLTFCFIFIFLATSIIIFLLHFKKDQILMDSKKIYRKGVKKAFFISFAITTVIGLKIYGLLSLLTGFLLIAFIASILRINAVNRRWK